MLKVVKIIIIFSLLLLPKLNYSQTTKEVDVNLPTLVQKISDFELANKMIKHEVIIFSIGDSSLVVCTGVVLKNLENKAFVLTAKHCLNETSDLYVENIKVIKTRVSSTQDIALLELDKRIPSKIESSFSTKSINNNDRIYGVGYGNSFEMPLIGQIILTTKSKHYARMQVKPGCSGAGIFSKQAKLIGLLVSSVPTFKLGVYIPIHEISNFLKEIHYESKF